MSSSSWLKATFPFHFLKQQGPAKNIGRIKLKQVYGPFLVCRVGPDQIRKWGPVPMQCERLDRSKVCFQKVLMSNMTDTFVWKLCRISCLLEDILTVDTLHNVTSIELIFFCLRDTRWQAVRNWSGKHVGWKRVGARTDPPLRENEKQFVGNATVNCIKTGWYISFI